MARGTGSAPRGAPSGCALAVACRNSPASAPPARTECRLSSIGTQKDCPMIVDLRARPPFKSFCNLSIHGRPFGSTRRGAPATLDAVSILWARG